MLLLFCVLLAAVAGCASEPEPPAEPAPAETPAGPTVADAIQRLQAQDPAGAAEILEGLTAAEPVNARAWSLLGQVRAGQNDLDGALAAYERAREADPKQLGAVYGVATVRARRGEHDAALDLLHELEESGKYDLSQIAIDPAFAELLDEPRFEALLMRPKDFADPFVEEVRVIHEWVGEAAGDEYGWIARNAGDVDGDGVADVVTSAPSHDGQAGKVYVYSGRSGKLLWQRKGQPGERLGAGLQPAGDVDGDGVPDVVAGAPAGGRVVVYSGRDGRAILTVLGAEQGEQFGNDVRGVGDLDGDGRSELLIGAPQHDSATGRAAVYSGRDGSLLREWRGERAGDRFGSAVAGQVGDAGTLLVVGAPDAGEDDAKGGRVYVYGGLAETAPRFVIEGDKDSAELGAMFLSVPGDVNADGVPDVYASDWSHGALGPSTGRIVVHSGASGEKLLELSGEAAGDGFGIGPADAGDVDGDGHADLVVGAWQHAGAAPGGGKVYVFSGKNGALIRSLTSRVMGDTFGFDATGMGDVDGDGKIDLLLTSAWSAIRGPKTGRMFLIAGG